MEDFIQEPSEKTPEITLRDGFVRIGGRSIPEDPKKLYRPVLQWVKEYVTEPPEHTEINIQLEYCDTGSTKFIFDVLVVLAHCRNTNHRIKMVFNWNYEKGDAEIMELGEFMQSKLNVLFNFVEV